MKLFPACAVLGLALLLSMAFSNSEELPAEVTVRLAGSDGKPSAPTTVATVRLSDQEWLKKLGPERYRILRSSGTEAPFCGTLLDNKKTGLYLCAGCDLPLFSSSAKFHSGTGWPSFFQPFAEENIAEITDSSHGMERTEIRCVRCGGHLGHVFPDGPRPSGLRYCLNSEALTFQEIK